MDRVSSVKPRKNGKKPGNSDIKTYQKPCSSSIGEIINNKKKDSRNSNSKKDKEMYELSTEKLIIEAAEKGPEYVIDALCKKHKDSSARYRVNSALEALKKAGNMEIRELAKQALEGLDAVDREIKRNIDTNGKAFTDKKKFGEKSKVVVPPPKKSNRRRKKR